MGRPRKPRVYIRPDPLGNPLDFCWFATLGVRTWCMGLVREKPLHYALEELAWLLRHG